VTRPFHFPSYDESHNVRTGFLEFEEYQALLTELPHYLKPLLIVAYHVPCRLGELLNLFWSQVDFRTNEIVLGPADVKNKQGRLMPIYAEMLAVLEMQRTIRDEKWPKCRYVFFGEEGRQIVDFRKAWRSACRRAGLEIDGERPLFHDLRRSAARNMRRAGIDEPTVMRIGGWKTASMFRRYSIVDSRDIADAVRKMEQFFESKKSAAGRKAVRN
jgi:integrase